MATAMSHSPLGFLSLLLAVVAADNSFISPPQASATVAPSTYPVYTVGDTLPISWTDNFGNVDLVISQVGSPVTEIDYLPDSTKLAGSTYNWPIRINGTDGGPKFDLLFSNQFNFLLFESGNTSPFTQSVTFNITNSTVGPNGKLRPTPTSATLTSTSSTSTSSSTSGSTTTTTGPASSTSTPSSGSSLSTGAKAGIGVGVSLGVIGIALAGFAVFWVRRKNARAGEAANSEWASPAQPAPAKPYSPGPDQPSSVSAKYAYQSVPPPPMQELQGHGDPQELPNPQNPARYELQ